MASGYTLTAALGVFTVTGQPTDTNTIVVGGKTYTWNAVVGTANGSVHLGATAADSIANLHAAINLDITKGETGTAAVDYGSSMTINTEVFVISSTATVLTVQAYTPGTVGNLIASTETHANGSWGAATLASGAGHVSGWMTDMLDVNQVNSEIAAEMLSLTAVLD